MTELKLEPEQFGLLGSSFLLDLQMFSRREAEPAHNYPVAGIGVRPDPRGTGTG
jgi:hypothetical protein